MNRRRNDSTAEAVLGAVAAGRIAIGVAAQLAPGQLLRACGWDDSDPAGRTLSRMTGARDIGFALLTLAAHGDPAALRRAALITAAADLGDCAAFGYAAARSDGRTTGLILSSLAGAGGAAASVWAARKLQG